METSMREHGSAEAKERADAAVVAIDRLEIHLAEVFTHQINDAAPMPMKERK